MLSINIPSIVEKHFGVSPMVMPQEPQPRTTTDNLVIPQIKLFNNKPIKYSFLGTPVYEVLWVRVPGGERLLFPDTTIVEAQLPIIVERTTIQGKASGGTIKEYIGEDDWRLRIYGLIINHDSFDYPINQVSDMTRICRKGQALEVTGMYLSELEIFNLVITNIDLPRKAGQPGIQPFTIEAISDNPYELILEDI